MRRFLTVGAVTAVVTSALFVALPSPAEAHPNRDFDLQAHRGGLGLVVENTLPAFANALELGVSTLELDVQITEDGHAVVTHDRKVNGGKCLDTGPAFAGDSEHPYVGKYIKDLTLEQVWQLDCGTQTQADFPGQVAAPGERMPLLSQVFDLVDAYRAHKVTLNIETKVEAGAPEETAPREAFAETVAADVEAADIADQVTVQSFDWGALMLMGETAPELPLVALTNYDFLQVGQEGASPWLGGIDIDDFGGDPIAAVDSFGVAAFSPVHGFPQNGTVDDPDYEPYVTAEMVDHAHESGIAVVPWTVDDEATMRSLIDAGVDGIITDYPDVLREVMRDYGFKLPKRYHLH
ncbi:glycerophosphodiester phosphodiesterase family protein [Glycomyces buryatensis]|uniref:Glycerophosphodiester phosphodiesterase n=1 Tax=Glycomyces buryatensis TaxID=2570927 RepID=A0A4S8QAJ9_9ACTN|nr:glycerophosphodiester phosphodiesterase family protein [Glycomyces buryatensis]THV39805.1 glycerophosphodiester phosphodiesterase [Glycomyces buryatensis]